MNELVVVAINTHSGSRSGPWAVAVSRYPVASGYSQMYSPVFQQQLAAEVFAEAMPRLAGRCEDFEGELDLARQIEAYIAQWDEAHGDDDPYPTANGRYPTFQEMARYFLAAEAA